MSTPPTPQIPQPAWLSKHPSEWPAEAHAAFHILATIAERRLARAKAAAQPNDGAPNPTDSSTSEAEGE